MRRMMHAAALFLASASVVPAQAQTTNARPLPSLSASTRSILAEGAEVHTSVEIGQAAAPQSTPHNHSAPTFLPSHSGRPYSHLLTYMSCDDWSPNLWNNYSNERAEIVARISKHVDMQCKCFEGGKHCLHAHASSCDECSSGIGGKSCGPKLINRYKTPISSLYAAPSDSCGSSCGSGCGSLGGGCNSCASSGNTNSCGCASCNGHAVATLPPSNHAIASRPSTPMLTHPVINTARVSVPMQQMQFSNEARR